MRKQHHVLHCDELRGHLGLALIDVEARRQDGLVLQRLDQRRLVHNRAARHVDEDAVGTERLEHGGVDQVPGLRAARRDDEHVDIARHLDEVGIVSVRDARRRPPRVIGHRHLHGLEPARDRLPDAAHADHADGAVTQRRLAQRIGLLRPLARAQVALGLRELAHGAKEQPQRGVGDLLGEHVRRVRDGNAVRGGPLGVDGRNPRRRRRQSRAGESAPSRLRQSAPRWPNRRWRASAARSRQRICPGP